ncbi:putative urease [Fusarium globosum]|uniref:Putative urease n=1 Tax=Fusarium globosum TaxID=78864 RepID=A0A8H6CX42_9HYPO|nr:putative urease [Fusarium globosum]
MVNLKDNQGQEIKSGPDHWYKIVLRDGRELVIAGGADRFHETTYLLAASHPGQGLILRYQRFNGDDRLNQGWPIGDKGYLRCGHYNKNGNVGVFPNSQGDDNIVVTDRDELAYGLQAEQMAGNRVSLYGYDKDGKLRGIRLGGGGNPTLWLDSDMPTLRSQKFSKCTTRPVGHMFKGGTIVGIVKAGNLAMIDGVSDVMVIGYNTDIAGAGGKSVTVFGAISPMTLFGGGTRCVDTVEQTPWFDTPPQSCQCQQYLEYSCEQHYKQEVYIRNNSCIKLAGP